jgi:hypothetical protein
VGESVEFATVVNGSGPLAYQWEFNSEPLIDDGRISGSRTPVLRIDSVLIEDEGGYQLIVTGPCGEASSAIATLTAICKPDVNGDGNVNTLDVITFLGFWAIKDPAADWNDDGTVNTIDFIQFLNAWVAGC